MKKLLGSLALLLALGGSAFAQGQSYTAGPFNQSGNLYVCPVPSGGTPCPAPVSIFTNVGLSTPAPNPIFMNAGSTVTFFAASGQYTIQYPASGYSVVISLGGSGGGLAATGVISATANGVLANGQVATTATWSNASSTITTGTNDPVVTSSNFGQIIFGTTSCAPTNGDMNCSSNAIPQGTILNTSSSHTINISTTTIAANQAADGTFTGWVVWGSDDTAKLQAAWSVTYSAPGQSLQLPIALMLVSSQPFANLGGSFYESSIFGPATSYGSAMIVPVPNFAYGSSVGGHIYAAGSSQLKANDGGGGNAQSPAQTTTLRNFMVWGAAWNGSSASTLPAIQASNLYAENVWVEAWNNTGMGATAAAFALGGSTLMNCGVWSAMVNALRIDGNGPTVLTTNHILAGYYFVNGGGKALQMNAGNLTLHGALFGSTSSNDSFEVAGGTVEDYGSVLGPIKATGGTLSLYGSSDNNFGNFGLFIAGGTVTSVNSQIDFVNMTSGTFDDQGLNHVFGSNSAWTTSGSTSITGGTILHQNSVVWTGAAVATNITPNTSWGTSGAAGNGVSVVSSLAQLIQFTVTAAGTPAANPTIAITWPVKFATTPGCSLRQIGGTGAFANITTSAISNMSATYIWNATPVAGQTYIFQAAGCQ